METGKRQDQAVAHIGKHEAEQQRYGDGEYRRRVDLVASRRTEQFDKGREQAGPAFLRQAHRWRLVAAGLAVGIGAVAFYFFRLFLTREPLESLPPTAARAELSPPRPEDPETG